MAVFASLRAVLDTVCPKIEQIIFVSITTCRKVCPSTATRTVLGSPKPLYKVTGRTSCGKRDRSPLQTAVAR